MKAKDIKTIHVVTKTWFDKVNGNTYFAQFIVINWEGEPDEKCTIWNKFQYGYSSYNHYALHRVAEVIGCDKADLKGAKIFGVVIRGCKKKDLYNTYPCDWVDVCK